MRGVEFMHDGNLRARVFGGDSVVKVFLVFDVYFNTFFAQNFFVNKITVGKRLDLHLSQKFEIEKRRQCVFGQSYVRPSFNL